MKRTSDPTQDCDFLEKRNIYYTGSGTVQRTATGRNETIQWHNKPCFAAWRGIPHGTIKELTYNPRIRELTIPRGASPVFQGGWRVVQQIFRTLPSYRSLRAGRILRANPRDWPLWEINLNWRAVRAFQEHPALLTSCHWLQVLYPHLPPEIHLAIASSYQVGPEGYLRPQWGGPHMSFNTDNGDLECILAHMRAFAYIRHHQGRVTGTGSFRRKPTSKESRDFMGYGLTSSLGGKAGYFTVEPEGGLEMRDVIGAWGDTPDALDLLMCTIARFHRRASTVAPATSMSLTYDDIPMSSIARDEARRRYKPW